MKKGISLIEILISITIFSFIVLSIYKTIELSKSEIKTTSNLIENIDLKNHIKSIFIEDFLESQKVVLKNKGDNSLLKLTSNNIFHNPLYKNITYILDSNKSLYRVESLNELEEKNIDELDINHVYIDLVSKNIEKFKVEKGKSSNYLIYIKNIDEEEFSLLIPYTLN